MCGENCDRFGDLGTNFGSSPRVRGKLAGEGQAQALARLIPACAGKTHADTFDGQAVEAHPRVCGEN